MSECPYAGVLQSFLGEIEITAVGDEVGKHAGAFTPENLLEDLTDHWSKGRNVLKCVASLATRNMPGGAWDFE